MLLIRRIRPVNTTDPTCYYDGCDPMSLSFFRNLMRRMRPINATDATCYYDGRDLSKNKLRHVDKCRSLGYSK